MQKPMEWATWLERVFGSQDYDMTMVSRTEPVDYGIYARGRDYYFGYVDLAFNAALGQLDATLDPAGRAALYREAQIPLAEDEAAIFLFQLAKAGVRNAKVAGLGQNTPIQLKGVTRVS